jgi:hypothetical protein
LARQLPLSDRQRSVSNVPTNRGEIMSDESVTGYERDLLVHRRERIHRTGDEGTDTCQQVSPTGDRVAADSAQPPPHRLPVPIVLRPLTV